MTVATITSKGQITLPKDVRDRLGLKPGAKVDILVEKNGTARMTPVTLRPSDVFGMLASKTSVRATEEEIREGLSKAFRKGTL
jgi:antitoxin PrlF